MQNLNLSGKHIFGLFIAKVALMALFVSPAFADSDDFDEPMINLSVSVSEEVAQDTLQATLTYQAQNINAARAQNEVNTNIRKALEIAKTYKGVKVTTGSYSTYEDQRKNLWRASHSVILDGMKYEKIVEISGRLQEMGFRLGGLSYYLSFDARQALTDQLISQALKKAQMRADNIARETGYKAAKAHRINHSEHGSGGPRPYNARGGMEMMAMAGADYAAPSAEADTSRVSVNVNVTYLLVD